MFIPRWGGGFTLEQNYNPQNGQSGNVMMHNVDPRGGIIGPELPPLVVNHLSRAAANVGQHALGTLVAKAKQTISSLGGSKSEKRQTPMDQPAPSRVKRARYGDF
jgi:hypothetical protein